MKYLILERRRLIAQNGLTLNDDKVSDVDSVKRNSTRWLLHEVFDFGKAQAYRAERLDAQR